MQYEINRLGGTLASYRTIISIQIASELCRKLAHLENRFYIVKCIFTSFLHFFSPISELWFHLKYNFASFYACSVKIFDVNILNWMAQDFN